MRTYKKLHENQEVAKKHIAKIKKRGGTLIKQSTKNGKILLEYDFKSVDDVDDELDKIFDELRDRYNMDDSREGHLTIVHNGNWEKVERNSTYLTKRSKMLVNKYYDLMKM